MSRDLSIAGLALAATLASITNSWGGVLTITADPGSDAAVWINDTTSPTDPVVTVHINKHGKGTLKLGSTAEEKKIMEIEVLKKVNGKSEWVYPKPNVGGTTVADFEPFDFPTFAALSGSLVTVIDYAALVQSGTTFTAGESVTVNGGDVLGVPSITVYDGSGISPTTTFLSVTDIADLPLYTGTATVEAIDSLQPVPEPSTFVLWGLGGLGFAISAIRRRLAR